MRQNSCWSACTASSERKGFLSQRVVGAACRRNGRIGVPTRPGLDAGIEVHRALLPAVADQSDARHVDRYVQEEIPAPEYRIEDSAEVFAGQALLDEFDTVARSLLGTDVFRGHDRDALGRDADVPQDERQYALANA